MTKSPSSDNTDSWNALIALLLNQQPIDSKAWVKPESWPAILAHIEWHHIRPDVASILVSEAEDREWDNGLSEQESRALRIQSMQARLDNLKKLQTQKSLSLCLTKAGISHLFFKGIVLGEWLYDKYDQRECGDIDLIVHPDEHSMAVEALLEQGFKQLVPLPSISSGAMWRYKNAMKDMVFIDPRTDVFIELHWRLRESEASFQFEFDHEYAQRRTIVIEGYGFACFSDQTHVRYLAMHGCLSYWGRLRWLIDWHRLAQETMDWQEIYQVARARKESRYLDLAFLTSQQVLSTPIPECLNILETTPKRFWVNSVVKGMKKNVYRNWLLRKGLDLISLNSSKKCYESFRALVRKATAIDTF